MKKLKSYYLHLRHTQTSQRSYLLPFVVCFALFLFLLLSITLTTPETPPFFPVRRYQVVSPPEVSFDSETKLKPLPVSDLETLPRLAYLISGSAGDGHRLRRTLEALYHPHNKYIVHLDAESSPEERLDLYTYVTNHSVFGRFKNVWMITKANLVTYRGPTMVANTLHAAAVMLRDGGEWDWFINLSAADYPLVTQDDLLHTFSYLPKDLNFIENSRTSGYREFSRAKPVIIDPGLYMSKKSEVFWVTQRRSVPTKFQLFHGSAWMVLSRPFIDYLVWGFDNLPRIALMYYSNIVSSPESYFHTVICNAPEFINTTVNSDLHFISWDNPPRQHPHYLTMNHMQEMIESNAPFARKFHRNDPVLDHIDAELLFRGQGMVVPGGWCIGKGENGSDPCSVVGNTTTLRLTAGAKRLQNLVSFLLSEENFRPQQCK